MMKRSLAAAILAAILITSFSALTVHADEMSVPVSAEEVITRENSQTDAIDAYRLLEHSLQFAYGGYPDHYAGCWLEGDVLCVGVTTEDKGVRSIYLDTLAPAKCRVEYKAMTYSYNQLQHFNELIWSDAASDSVSFADTYGINSSGIVCDRNCVEVTSAQGYSDELYNALVSLAGELGEDIFELQKEAVTLFTQTEQVTVSDEIPDSESGKEAESIPYPDPEPQTSPQTVDSAAILCLVFSALSAAGIIVCRRENPGK